MKESKVASTPIGLTKNNQRLQDFINDHAHEGWEFRFYGEQNMTLVFEHERNR